MKYKLILRAGFILLLLLGSITLASAKENDRYIVTPAIGPVGDGKVLDDSGPDKAITFWDLPLWVQLSVIGGATLSTFALSLSQNYK
jgi:predicted transcriptional regulator